MTAVNPANVPKVKLNNGKEVPCMGMGTFGSDRFTSEQGKCVNMVEVKKAERHAAAEGIYTQFLQLCVEVFTELFFCVFFAEVSAVRQQELILLRYRKIEKVSCYLVICRPPINMSLALHIIDDFLILHNGRIFTAPVCVCVERDFVSLASLVLVYRVQHKRYSLFLAAADFH